MSPDEVIQKLKMMGVNSSRATLLRYKEAGLIPKPEEGAGGRGVGRFSDYPSDTALQYFASHYIMKSKHASFGQAAEARQEVLRFRLLFDFFGGFNWDCFDNFYSYVRGKYRAKYSKWLTLKSNDWKEFADSGQEGLEPFKSFVKFYQTPFAVEWWELIQIASGKIDANYVEFCQRISHYEDDYSSRGNVTAINEKLHRLHELLSNVTHDIKALLETLNDDDGSIPPNDELLPLGKWIALHKQYPDLQPVVRGAMLANYRQLRSATADLLVTGKLPEV